MKTNTNQTSNYQKNTMSNTTNSNSNSNSKNKDNQFYNSYKYEVANEVGVNLKNGYNGDIKARDAGRVGGTMVKKLIGMAEQSLSR
mgnify:CR=1 FL=1